MSLSRKYTFLGLLLLWIQEGNATDIPQISFVDHSEPITIPRHYHDSLEQSDNEGEDRSLPIQIRRDTQYSISPFDSERLVEKLDWDSWSDGDFLEDSATLEELKQREQQQKIKKGMGVLFKESIPLTLGVGTGTATYYILGAVLSIIPPATPLLIFASSSVAGLSYIGLRLKAGAYWSDSPVAPLDQQDEKAKLIFSPECEDEVLGQYLTF